VERYLPDDDQQTAETFRKVKKVYKYIQFIHELCWLKLVINVHTQYDPKAQYC
jgi:hypothetical protein